MENILIAKGIEDLTLASKASIRAVVWFALGAHVADNADAFFKVAREAVTNARDKSQASRWIGRARKLAEVLEARAGAEMASNYTSELHRGQAIYLKALADGVTTVERLDSWIASGDATSAEKAKVQAAEAKAAEKAEAAAAQLAEIAKLAETAEPIGFDMVPGVADPAPVPDFQPMAWDADAIVEALSDDQVEALVKAIAKRKRAEAAAAKAA